MVQTSQVESTWKSAVAFLTSLPISGPATGSKRGALDSLGQPWRIAPSMKGASLVTSPSHLVLRY